MWGGERLTGSYYNRNFKNSSISTRFYSSSGEMQILQSVEKKILLEIENTDFDPIKFKDLQKSESFSFMFLSEIFEKIAKTKGKDSKSVQKEIFCNFFRLVNIYFPTSLVPGFSLSTGRVCSSHSQTELGIGEGMIYKLLGNLTKKPKKQIKLLEDQLGDISQVGFQLHKADTSFLSIPSVYESLSLLALIHGPNSTSKKEKILFDLFNSSSNLEVKYLIRLIQKSLRIGASELTVIESLSNAIEITPPKQDFPHKSFQNTQKLKIVVDKVSKTCPEFEKIVNELRNISPISGYEDLVENCKACVGYPIQPMSAYPVKDLNEVVSRFGAQKLTCEYKYDGIRGQIHLCPDGKVLIFSRGSENITESYPDICEAIKDSVREQIKSCVIDCEIVPIDPVTGLLKPFSDIQSRKKKYKPGETIQVPVCVFVFDLLLLNDKSLIERTLLERRTSLHTSIQELKGKIHFVEFKDLQDVEEVLSVLQDAVERGCEGLMIKILNEKSEYEPGVRSFNWLKLKKDYLSSGFGTSLLPDSLDLVPIGAFYGSGKRKGLFGSFLLACFDEESSEFQTVCKIGTGFSDKFLLEQSQKLKSFEIADPPDGLRYRVTPDVWFQPKVVWEIQAADLSISPTHTSAWDKVHKEKGISIRFPRFIRERTDKTIHQLTQSSEILKLYTQQTLTSTSKN